jgi:hypothetical protein
VAPEVNCPEVIRAALGALVVTCLLAACSSEKAPLAPSPAAASSDLSLVYMDSRSGQNDLYTTTFNGGNPRRVATLPSGTRPAAVRGHYLATAGTADILLVDLSTGVSQTVNAGGRVGDVRFIDDKTVLFTTASGCGPGGTSSSLVTLDVPSLQQHQVASLPSANLGIAGGDAGSGVVALIPRGCDVGVGAIQVLKLTDGSIIQTVPAMGCGWAAASLESKRAVISLRSCTSPPGKAGVDAVIYDFSAVPTSMDLHAPAGGANSEPWLIRPGAPQAALGTSATNGPGPGQTAGSGIWLLDLASAGFTQLSAGEGAEQFPVAWSSNGRYLLSATVAAQGLCSYSYIDATTKEVKPIDAGITFCGVNGSVLGWTNLR